MGKTRRYTKRINRKNNKRPNKEMKDKMKKNGQKEEDKWCAKHNSTKEEKQEVRNKEGSTQTMKQKRQDEIDMKNRKVHREMINF